MTKTNVCPQCVDDPDLQDFIRGYADAPECDFCGQRSDDDIAAPVEDLAQRIIECLNEAYGHPEDLLPWDSAEGGWQAAEVWSTEEVLNEQVGLELPNDDSGELRNEIVDSIGECQWCPGSPFRFTTRESFLYGWREFCETVKYKTRFFFLQGGSRKKEPERIPTIPEVLRTLADLASKYRLLAMLPAGLTMFRARHQPAGEKYRSPLELGPPPQLHAVQSNRMTPPGIVAFYASDSVETAMLETATQAGQFAAAKFKLLRRVPILDLTRLDRLPSFFADADLEEKEFASFFRGAEFQMSQRIARDDRVHIEYLPTQVVAEYFRTVARLSNSRIRGIAFRSSAHPGGKSYCLFFNQADLQLSSALAAQLTEPEATKYRWRNRNPMLRLISVEEVCAVARGGKLVIHRGRSSR